MREDQNSQNDVSHFFYYRYSSPLTGVPVSPGAGMLTIPACQSENQMICGYKHMINKCEIDMGLSMNVCSYKCQQHLENSLFD